MTRTTERSMIGENGAMGDSGARLPTGTVTLLLTDLEGSTRLWLEATDAAPASIERHDAILDETVSRHDGVEQGEGDSLVAGFERPADALAAAVDIQRAFAAEVWPAIPLRVRVGLHTGDVELRGEDKYQGPSIIRCARLRNAGHGGQIVVSD